MEDRKNDCILLINDAVDEKLANDIIKWIDRSIEEGWSRKEEYGKMYNVICDFIHVQHIPDHEERTEIDKKIFKAVGKLFQRVNQQFRVQLDTDSGYCLRRIYGATREHSDGIYTSEVSGNPQARGISIIIALNDDYEGGEFNFPLQGKKFKLEKYQAAVFPPYWTHPHSVSEPTTGVRYTINTWGAQHLNKHEKDFKEPESSY